jgi:hypothetical protein
MKRPNKTPSTVCTRQSMACWVIATTITIAAASVGARAGEVVAHPSVALNAAEIRDLYLGDKQLLGNLRLVPVDNIAQQGDFLLKVLQTDAPRYAARWTKKAFREGLTAPVVRGSDAEIIAFVMATPGAVAYVSSSVGASSQIKVLQRY